MKESQLEQLRQARASRMRKWREANPERAKKRAREDKRRCRRDPEWRAKEREAQREWRRANPEKQRAIMQRSYRKRMDADPYYNAAVKFGISSSRVSALYEAQQHLCAICGRPERETNSRTGKVKLLAIDHCHLSTKIRGLLCSKCNQGIGSFGDDPERMRAAAAYIESGGLARLQ